MSLKDALIAELKYEAINTRKMLERTPEDKYQWRPHDKSMTIGRLASHIAELPVWISRIMQAEEFDFATAKLSPTVYGNTEALLKVFEEQQTGAIEALLNASEEELNARYTVRRGEQVMFQLPRKIMIRNLTLNHIVHHRGQLSVFLRLLNIPVPGMYGPSADER